MSVERHLSPTTTREYCRDVARSEKEAKIELEDASVEDIRRWLVGLQCVSRPHARSLPALASAGSSVVIARGRIRQAKGMNRQEADYALALEARRQSGEILWYRFEAIKLRIGEKCFYTPDFLVMTATGELECHEVKGFFEDDARVKLRAVAEMYPFRFVAIYRDGRREEF